MSSEKHHHSHHQQRADHRNAHNYLCILELVVQISFIGTIDDALKQ
jgi:hypothetical protein